MSYPVRVREMVPWRDRLGVLFEHHGPRIIVYSIWTLIIIGVVFVVWPRSSQAIQYDAAETMIERLERLEKNIARLEAQLAQKQKHPDTRKHSAHPYFKDKELQK